MTGPTGQYFGRLLADLGADVIKLEPPEGDESRKMAPFAGDRVHPDGSLFFLNYNTNKRSLALDLASAEGRETVARLVSTTDIVVESFSPGFLDGLGLGYQSLSAINSALVMTSITPFGRVGPYRDYLGSELVAQAMGGMMYIQGDDKLPPCAAPCEQASQLASLHAAFSTLAALRHRSETGLGQHVDASMQDVVAHLLFSVARYAYNGEIVRRTGITSTLAPNNYYRCKDGYVSFSVFFDHHWRNLQEWMGIEALAGPVWEDINFRRNNADIVDSFVSEFIGGFTVNEFVEQGQERHLAISPMSTVEDLVNSPQLKERAYFVEGLHPHVGDHRIPGAPYRFSKTPWKIRRPAPMLGQHNAEISDELDGDAKPSGARATPRRHDDASRPPLSGVRIVDFTRVWAGPFATRYLGDLGAEVIRIETSGFLDTGRLRRDAGAIFPEINRNKLGITLNFRTPEGVELVKRLVELSDVVVENFAAGVLDRRGLGYEDLERVKPDLIMMSMPGHGNTGPYAGHVAYGQTLMSYCALSHLWGYPESPPEARGKVHYADFVSAATGAMALTAALEHRAQTGEGQYIELAQAEALASTMGVALTDYLVNGRSWDPVGNRNLNAAPHGSYPCRGDDQWCAISCSTDGQWVALCGAMGRPEWTKDSMFESLASRYAHHHELDAHIGRWTRDYTADQAMRLLQGAGVPAGAVQSGEQMYHDHHLRARNFIVEVEHPGIGMLENTGITASLSRSPGRIDRGVPELGQHNAYVFSELLGRSHEQIALLTDAKVID